MMAHSSPDRFAGAFAWASDAGEGLEPENLRHTPVLISGGGGRATAFVDQAEAAGLEEVIVLDPDAAEAEFVAWIGDKTRANYPTKITVVPQGKYPYRSHWIQFAPVSDTEGVRVDAEVDRGANTITLTSSGIREVSVFFCDDLVDMSKPVTVIANGVTLEEHLPPKREHVPEVPRPEQERRGPHLRRDEAVPPARGRASRVGRLGRAQVIESLPDAAEPRSRSGRRRGRAPAPDRRARRGGDHGGGAARAVRVLAPWFGTSSAASGRT